MEQARHEHAHAHADVPRDLPKVTTPAILIAGVVVIAAFVALFLIGWIPRHDRRVELEKQAKAANDSRPVVQIAQPKRDGAAVDVILPADVRSFQETALFPRATGYLKRQLVDIGDRVEKDQLLAEIAAPDLDAELNQAKASEVSAKANLAKSQSDRDLAQTTLKRYQAWAQSGGVTEQDLDQRRATLNQSESVVNSSQADVQVAHANVERLTALAGFEKITAPFAGIITARNYDVGALMSSGSTSGKELFRIAETDLLRVFVNVPQSYVTAVKTGQHATLMVRNYPGHDFDGVVTRSAGALDPATRTLRYEIDVPNKDGRLYSGMYGQIRLHLNQEQPPMKVPSSAVVFDSAGTKVWVVDDGKVHNRKVSVGRDFGTDVEISDGLSGNEQVVTNPGERLAEGGEVQITGPEAPPAQRQAQLSVR
jgi:RND family efflux transporter MFP subunit